jgi:NAD(P)-dependent dehydrogenase (short-subunit alcohol dehydrogenase family)
MSRVAIATGALRETGRATALGLARDLRAVPIVTPPVKVSR